MNLRIATAIMMKITIKVMVKIMTKAMVVASIYRNIGTSIFNSTVSVINTRELIKFVSVILMLCSIDS